MMTLAELVERWSAADPSERANYQLYISELCDALGVARPQPAGSGYQFEYPVKVVNRDGTETTNFIDLYRAGHFVLEAKDQDRGEPDSVAMRRAFGQARTYASQVIGNPPPFILVLDVGDALLIWDRWTGSYGGFNSARRINLRTLHKQPEDAEGLRLIIDRPDLLDPNTRAEAVTREVAEKLAQVASSLEARGNGSDEVAAFLIRCVFTMFAEDIELIPDRPFQKAVEEIGLGDPEAFQDAVEALWRAMDVGETFGLRKLPRFNGHFFAAAAALPLETKDLVVLAEAARCDWSDVEPSVMGTLLTRALNPAERHRLGAEYTPSSYVQRIVRPTVEEPIRERWTSVQAEVLELTDPAEKGPRRAARKKKKALARLREFHTWLRNLRFLDPACGSGNFLYVTLRLVKQLEAEVLLAIEEITGHPDVQVEEVGPWQFMGIEVKAWAREIAELTLWVGHFQIWRELHGRTQPPEPVLRDAGNLEVRDAVLEWDGVRADPKRAKPDPDATLDDPVTGQPVPDPAPAVPYLEHVEPRQAPWPTADFIVGNPPYMGDRKMRRAFGDGYVDALRSTYDEVPNGADYVMHWWYRAAEAVCSGNCIRAGLITTNSITQKRNRAVVKAASAKGAKVVWAVADHPWVDEVGGADIRVAMTVIAGRTGPVSLVEVDEQGRVVDELKTNRLNPDLSARVAQVARAAEQPLLANARLSAAGFILNGKGFRIEDDEAHRLLETVQGAQELVRQLRNGRDLTVRNRNRWVIDFGMRTENEAREWPVLYDIVRTRVKPHRDANKKRAYREYWWRFGEPQPRLRDAVRNLRRMIVTPDTSEFKPFFFLSTDVAPSFQLRVIASDDPFHLGVLSSRIHRTWAFAAGAKMGVGNDPRYLNTLCFDPFPFPEATDGQREEIGRLGEAIDQHRWDAVARDPRLAAGRLYSIIKRVQFGFTLEDDERADYELGACATWPQEGCTRSSRGYSSDSLWRTMSEPITSLGRVRPTDG